MDALANQDINVVIHSSITGFEEASWNKVVEGKGVFLSIPYLKALEQAGIPGLTFRFALLKIDGEPVAAYCFQLVDLSFEGIGGILNLENYGGLSSSIAGTINNMLFKNAENYKPMLLVCGSLLSSGEYGIVAQDDVAIELFHGQILVLITDLIHQVVVSEGLAMHRAVGANIPKNRELPAWVKRDVVEHIHHIHRIFLQF